MGDAIAEIVVRNARTSGTALLLLTVADLGCRSEDQQHQLHVSTAASMQEPITELAGPGAMINAAASSMLARQIESGAPIDLFISADLEWADYVAAHAKILERKVIASNRLVLIATSSDTRTADELLGTRLALADPSHVPAGKYAQAALQKMGWYHEDSIASAADVRAALALVERGEVAAGVVYRTDALLSKKVRVVSEIESPTPIQYAAILLTEAARPLFDRLTAAEGQKVFARYGFLPP